jgi:hypothetical protein
VWKDSFKVFIFFVFEAKLTGEHKDTKYLVQSVIYVYIYIQMGQRGLRIGLRCLIGMCAVCYPPLL